MTNDATLNSTTAIINILLVESIITPFSLKYTTAKIYPTYR